MFWNRNKPDKGFPNFLSKFKAKGFTLLFSGCARISLPDGNQHNTFLSWLESWEEPLCNEEHSGLKTSLTVSKCNLPT